jgi:hypothetical protein
MVWNHLLNVEHFRPVPVRISSAGGRVGGLRCWVWGLDYPQTGLEEINGDLLEADFWPRMTFGLPVTQQQLPHEPTFP